MGEKYKKPTKPFNSLIINIQAVNKYAFNILSSRQKTHLTSNIKNLKNYPNTLYYTNPENERTSHGCWNITIGLTRSELFIPLDFLPLTLFSLPSAFGGLRCILGTILIDGVQFFINCIWIIFLFDEKQWFLLHCKCSIKV